MILDPTFKTKNWKKQACFIQENYHILVDSIIRTFLRVAKGFEDASINNPQSTPSTFPSTSQSKNQPADLFSSELYDEPDTSLNSAKAEMKQYLKEDPKPKETKPLAYWAARQKTFPILSKMARQFLAIPATSALLERVFSKGR